MDNAAIIIFRRSTLPKLLRFLAMPVINHTIEVGNTEKKVRVLIIDCPVLKNSEDNRKVAKSLYSLCVENDISFFIGRNIEYYLGSGLEYVESRIIRGTIDEIGGIKSLAALIKLSVDKNSNLLKRNMCFLGASYSYQYISAMSEEASGVLIYEHEKMSNNIKRTIFERLMAEKGISAAFTRDLDRAISQCDIIAADDTVELGDYLMSLSGKILIGNNPAAGKFEKVIMVRLWYESLEGLTEDNSIIYFNDEILGILRYFYKDKSPIDFIRRFPYIICK